jgi:hypothetical protein
VGGRLLPVIAALSNRKRRGSKDRGCACGQMIEGNSTGETEKGTTLLLPSGIPRAITNASLGVVVGDVGVVPRVGAGAGEGERKYCRFNVLQR